MALINGYRRLHRTCNRRSAGQSRADAVCHEGKRSEETALEDLGRVRLSKNFFLREFLHSEIADFQIGRASCRERVL